MASEANDDHNYVGSRRIMVHHNSSDSHHDLDQPIAVARRTRSGLTLGRTRPPRQVENTDHDYLARQDVREEDADLFEDEEAEAEDETTDEQEQQPNAVIETLPTASVDVPPDPPPEISYPLLEQGGRAISLLGVVAVGNDVIQRSSGLNVVDAPAAIEVVTLTSPSPPKKRKRLALGTPKSNTPKVKSSSGNASSATEDEDDGLTCPICLDTWEMSGEHRLVSLRCGHLFGDACIRRWLNESSRQTGVKTCPQCKTRAANRDIRCLYAKRLRAIDRSEEHRLREQLDDERRRTLTLQTELSTMKVTHTMVMQKFQTLEAENDRMKKMLTTNRSFSYDAENSNDSKLILQRLKLYKIFMERNIEISREPGCRVILHAEQNSTLIASQKSTQSIFPGYGIRFIDAATFRTSHFLHTSGKLVRDMCLSADQQLLAVTSMETRAKLFDLRTRQTSAVFSPGDKSLWACAMDCKSGRENSIYFGASNGSTYIYDLRFSETIVEELITEGDLSPVINIAPVSAGKHFPNGGLVVCKLQSLWFYETDASFDGTYTPTRLSIEGPFSSMNFDAAHDTLLVSTRNSARYPQSRYVFGKLEKLELTPVFNVKTTFYGSKASPVMTRSTQIAVEENTLLAGYIQDVKLLGLFDVRREQRVQSLPVHEVVYDTCPVYLPNATYLAALTETKCRIYKLATAS